MLHVVHHPDYVAPSPPGSAFPFDKYRLVMDALADAGAAMTVYAPEPMAGEWIDAVHDPAYVEEVLALAVPREKERRIGFPITARVARRAVLAPGGTWAAALLAIEHGYAANAAGGSHHALYDTGAGYCVFNDLAITAHRLLAEGRASRVMIVDLDVHQGDGTAALLAGRADVFTFSMHAEKNFPVRKVRSSLDVGVADGMGDAAYLALLAEHLSGAVEAFDPDLMLYQSGVDPHQEDRLGRLSLSDAGLAARDRLVMAAAGGRPLASALGGGYGTDRMAVARRHAAVMLTLAQANDGRMHA